MDHRFDERTDRPRGHFDHYDEEPEHAAIEDEGRRPAIIAAIVSLVVLSAAVLYLAFSDEPDTPGAHRAAAGSTTGTTAPTTPATPTTPAQESAPPADSTPPETPSTEPPAEEPAPPPPAGPPGADAPTPDAMQRYLDGHPHPGGVSYSVSDVEVHGDTARANVNLRYPGVESPGTIPTTWTKQGDLWVPDDRSKQSLGL